ncbi:MAG TPA: hypothetical protein VH391_02380 [Solirubrobacterales bacterium]
MAKKKRERKSKPESEERAEDPAPKRNAVLEALRRAALRRTSTSR